MRTKKRRLISFVSLSFALIIMTTLMLGSVVMAAPTSDMLVIDNADMLTKEEEQTIENALYQVYKQTDIEYVVYLAPSLDGKTIEEASLEAGRKLGVGDKEDNTGLLIYVALADREFRMEVGYGLEGVIPDSQAKKIIDCMTSFFKEEKYADGLLAAITKTVYVLNDSGEYTITQDESYVVESKDDPVVDAIIVFIIVLMLVMFVANIFLNGSDAFGSSGSYYSGNSGSSHSSGSFGGGSFGGGGASGGW